MGAIYQNCDLWESGLVPFEIDPALSNTGSILTAIKHFETNTNLRFVRHTVEADYMYFTSQTVGFPNAERGRQSGRTNVRMSTDLAPTLIHEMGHALGMMHEHQRPDRDNFLIMHPDKYAGDEHNYAIEPARYLSNFDYDSIMIYDAAGGQLESKTGVPPAADIGGSTGLTSEDIAVLNLAYPHAPVVRRGSGEGGAGAIHGLSSAVSSLDGSGLFADGFVVALNGGLNYHLTRWKIYPNGATRRYGDPAGSIRGKATGIGLARLDDGRLVAGMAAADGHLLLISHGADGTYLADSGSQAGAVRSGVAIQAAPGGGRVITACVTASSHVLLIAWNIAADGKISRAFDSGQHEDADWVSLARLGPGAGGDIWLTVQRSGDGHTVLSSWRVDNTSIRWLGNSGTQMGPTSVAKVVPVGPDKAVVVCRTASDTLKLIPFRVDASGAIQRLRGNEAEAGVVRELNAHRTPYGIVTPVIAEGGRLLVIKWGVAADGKVSRLGDSAYQAGNASSLSSAVMPFAAGSTLCTFCANASGDLLPIAWDDAGGPGEI